MDNNNKREQPTDMRQAYVAPQLSSYGAVRDLTTGGTGGPNEFGPGKNPNRKA